MKVEKKSEKNERLCIVGNLRHDANLPQYTKLFRIFANGNMNQ